MEAGRLRGLGRRHGHDCSRRRRADRLPQALEIRVGAVLHGPEEDREGLGIGIQQQVEEAPGIIRRVVGQQGRGECMLIPAYRIPEDTRQRSDQFPADVAEGHSPVGQIAYWGPHHHLGDFPAEPSPCRRPGIVSRQRGGQGKDSRIARTCCSQVRPQPVGHRVALRRQAIPDRGHLGRAGGEEPTVEILALPRVERQQGEAGMEPRLGIAALLVEQAAEAGLGPAPIFRQLTDDLANSRRIGAGQPLYQVNGIDRVISLPSDDGGEDRQEGGDEAAEGNPAARRGASSGAGARSNPFAWSGAGCSPIPARKAGSGPPASRSTDAVRSASSTSARPRRVSRCLRVSHSRRECTR